MREGGPGFPLRSDPGHGAFASRSGLFTGNESSVAAGRRAIRYEPVKPMRDAVCRSGATNETAFRVPAGGRPRSDAACA
jgi:hypothetical protein